MNNSIRHIILFAILLYTSVGSGIVFASNGHGGSGGDGIEIDGHVYLFDLYEQGVGTSPFIDMTASPFSDVREKLQEKFASFKMLMDQNHSQGLTTYGYENFVDVLSIKLSNILRTDRLFGSVILQAFLHYNWLLSARPIEDAEDDDGSDIVFSGDLVPVAIRNFRSIRFNNQYTQKMNLGNMIATAIHEAAYAVIKPEKIGRSGRTIYFKQQSRRVREVVGVLFSGPVTAENIRNLAGGSFPIKARGNYILTAKIHEGKQVQLRGNYQVKPYSYDRNVVNLPNTTNLASYRAELICSIGHDYLGKRITSIRNSASYSSWTLFFSRFLTVKGYQEYLSVQTSRGTNKYYIVPKIHENLQTCIQFFEDKFRYIFSNNKNGIVSY